MAVSDLTNTTWLFNSSIDLSTTGVTPIVEGEVQYKSITFTSNNRNYVKLIVGSTNGVRWNVFAYGYEGFSADDVYMSGYWTDEAFRTIEITGGTDVTNASLISWLEANATQVVNTGKTQIGNRAITKKMFGTREITKEVVNGVTIYEKATPSGYSVSGNNAAAPNADAYYSTDDGATWLSIPGGNFTLPSMATFKLKIEPGADYLIGATSTQLGLNLPLNEYDTQISSNYTLTQNITDLSIIGQWD